ncbi:MAG: phage major capsid protein [Clostridia bacterium]|nr:phage major capsid protein [Clostridia bacterium]
MAVNLTNADSALKSYYLEAVSEQLNGSVNPFLAQIKKTSENVWGKEVKQLAIHGINGGIGAGTEDGNLPTARGNRYAQFTSTLKNLYGTIEISDKAIRASENNSGAFVSLLNQEMEGLIKASSFNLGRMLFGDGSGVLAAVTTANGGSVFTLDTVAPFMEGMIVDFRTSAGVAIEGATEREIIEVNRASKTIKVSGTALTSSTVPATSVISVHGSYNNEITGLAAIFNDSVTTLYGVTKSTNTWIKPKVKAQSGAITEAAIQSVLDSIEEAGGEQANLIITSFGVRRAFINLLSQNKRTVDSIDLAGGFKALSYNGIPVIADRFCPAGTMYILNTKDFTLNELCDWQWLTDDDGKVLRQVPGKPVYTATLVKYAELICARPYAQGAITSITEA